MRIKEIIEEVRNTPITEKIAAIKKYQSDPLFVSLLQHTYSLNFCYHVTEYDHSLFEKPCGFYSLEDAMRDLDKIANNDICGWLARSFVELIDRSLLNSDRIILTGIIAHDLKVGIDRKTILDSFPEMFGN